MKKTIKRIKPNEAGPFQMGNHEFDVITVGGELHIITPIGAIVINLEDIKTSSPASSY